MKGSMLREVKWPLNNSGDIRKAVPRGMIDDQDCYG
jgi:hypothetical protein